MNVVEIDLDKLTPYERNPRKNDAAVDKVAASIKEFGFKVPIVIDNDGIIVTGHTRYKAAQALGLQTVPCVIADDLTEEQIKAFRLVDNKVGEIAEWDLDILADELVDISEIDISEFAFDLAGDTNFFERTEFDGDKRQEENEEYNEFLDKFEAKKTTDDCYTPDIVYEAVADWVSNEYGIDRSRFVRPFYPGGDYQKFKYADDAVVVDNPPFSISAEIEQWYIDHGIDFFIFKQGLTVISSLREGVTGLCVGVTITYENEAHVNTSFVTNLEEKSIRVRTCPSLYKVVDAAAKEFAKGLTKELPKYSYPDEIVTAAMLNRWSKYGVDFAVSVDESFSIGALDAQKKEGKTIFGKGYLLSERAAAERAAAERAAAERAAAVRWQLSERERKIVESLSNGSKKVESQDKKRDEEGGDIPAFF